MSPVLPAGSGAARPSLAPGCGTTCSFLFTVGLRRHDSAVEPAQPCCSALLRAEPRHLQTTCSPSETPQAPIPAAEQAVTSRRCFLGALLGEVISCGVLSQAAMLCLEHCLHGVVTASSVSFHPCPAAKRCRVPLPVAVGCTPWNWGCGRGAASRLGLNQQCPLLVGLVFSPALGLQALLGHALQPLEWKPADPPSEAGEGQSPLWLPCFLVIPDC